MTLIIITISILSYNLFLEPAYESVLGGCNITPIEATGTTTFVYNKTTDEVHALVTLVKFEDDTLNERIKKHELCHIEQYSRGWIRDCDKNKGKLLRFIAEVECNVRMYL